MSIAQAIAFYKMLGKRPVRLRKEMKGHIANRLQAAILREVFHLVAEDVAGIVDIDATLSQGPGLRWAIPGPTPRFPNRLDAALGEIVGGSTGK